MYRLTRLLFSPWTYLVLFMACVGIIALAEVAAVYGYIAALGRVGYGALILEQGLIVAIEAKAVAPFIALVALPVMYIRALIVEFWPGTRPWLYFGPKPGALAARPAAASTPPGPPDAS